MKITKEIIYENLLLLLEQLFKLPEVTLVRICDLGITSPESTETIAQAVEDSYHDYLSDIDLKIYLSANRSFSPKDLGWTKDQILGISQSGDVIRAVLKNGMRYDLVFSTEEPPKKVTKQTAYTNAGWSLEQTENFWFIAVQALGKLYRNDYLIADHLTNMLINESLVIQMVDRDNQYNTNIHRYGHAESLTYQEMTEDAAPFPLEEGKPATFYHIAKKLFAATKAYDQLVPILNQEYQPKVQSFYELWQAYENGGN